MSTESLLLISLGPVQEFIVAARRTHDLWFGSWLLSELSKAAAKAIADQCGLDQLIFPAPGSLESLDPASDLSVANKIVALIPVATTPATVARAARAAVHSRLEALWGEAAGGIHGAIREDAAGKQREDLVEFAWVALPLADRAAYAATRRQLEALMAARKATRTFGPVQWAGPYHKSSLDGLRETVIDLAEIRKRSDAELYADYGIRRGEHLCGIGLLKRHGRRAVRGAPGQDEGQGRFFSTSHVAALPLLTSLAALAAMPGKQGQDKQAVDRYIKALQQAGITKADLGNVPARKPNGPFGYYDGHLLFEERLAEYILPDPNLPDTEPQIAHTMRLDSARQALKNFLQSVFGKPAPIPCPYYALLHADGDGMGRAIDAQTSVEAHRTLSQALDAFAARVRGTSTQPGIVERHQGSLVYTGGDDILAFVPLHTVLPCARELADTFRERLSGFRSATVPNPTLSVGIAIVHHLDPLSDALELARKAEGAAKELREKNALAVTLSPRSGVDRRVRGTWQEVATQDPRTFDQRLMHFARAYAANQIPDGLAFEWANLHQRLDSADDALSELLVAPLRADARRILVRKRTESGKQIDAEVYALLDRLAATVVLRAPEHAPTPLTLAQVADELIIARTIAEGIRQAELPPARAEGDKPNAAAAD